MKKQIMSIAACAALLTTGAMAFDTTSGTIKVTNNATGAITPAVTPVGTIITEKGGKIYKSSYTTSSATGAVLNATTGLLRTSTTQRGDALIYPAFNQKTGWGTEIVVRNTSENAIVAKAVVYAGDDSRELVDFNIYLSAKDVCRFTIKDGKITSTDGSIRTFGIFPHQVNLTSTTQDLTDYAKIKFADEKNLSIPMTTTRGYVAIYGMEQSSDFTGFHSATRDHKDLYAAYAASLDHATTGRGSSAWRQLTNSGGAMVNGMFVKDVTVSPNVVSTSGVIQFKKLVGTTLVDSNVTFTDVAPVLTGSVRISNDEGRDLLLPAKALENFTHGNRVLWTEGEYASIADRRIITGAYNTAAIVADAESAFPETTAVYTYANASGSTDNTLLLTQPYKRTLAQLDVAEDHGYTVGATNESSTTLATGTKFAFKTNNSIFDEDENGFEAAPDEIGGTIITSPRTSDDSVAVVGESFNNELQEIKPENLEKSSGYAGKFDNLNGIIDVTIPVGAIVTQMTASKAGSSDETNWVYSDRTN